LKLNPWPDALLMTAPDVTMLPILNPLRRHDSYVGGWPQIPYLVSRPSFHVMTGCVRKNPHIRLQFDRHSARNESRKTTVAETCVQAAIGVYGFVLITPSCFAW